MKTSVLIIAHNEEQHIEQCITSVLNQTQKPDEIVLIAHNCTDRTVSIARQYPVTVVEFQGPQGITYARIKGLQYVSGDIIVCTDGDSYVARNWVEVMVRTLGQGNVFVGSWVRYEGNVFGKIHNVFNKYLCTLSKKTERWIWGASMGFWKRDIDFVRKVWEKSFELTTTLGLTRNPDDYWLGLFMKRHGKLRMTNKTWVTAHTQEVSSAQAVARHAENIKNGNIMETYVDQLPDLLKVLE